MLSYQHAYHAGNLADVQKHALLARALDYLTRKDKPLSYIETHSGRGLYDLAGAEALKTGEAAQGITLAEAWLPADHPYLTALNKVRAAHGKTAYPGSPLIAQNLLRDMDKLHLAELHPQEYTALRGAVRAPNTKTYQQDGFALAQSLCPPDPRRGLLLIDPSWEVKSDYQTIPKAMTTLAKKWNVGILMLWYPILTDGPHKPMLKALQASFPEALRHEVRFPPARKGHRMVGSGMFVVNPPWGLEDEAKRLTAAFGKVAKQG
ncbi:23S rRNA (adenine(2030)-N(6))-methyltransferase RlmJ [Tropicibacter naphthalenivorans]|uniref:Ribosomal RNA large subunit methyltransferase J n=1 Tax=Tropicibacter naphthalenivorans TaxID=441103 RepID=A0A0P1G3K6_9RHOB|nr:23S rRNA (adenine(2030)-N(6))-methyltransferase RlmJ [Tropicibacter naphthalenivorans]CUH76400.1 Ribosomal RNA large subunit methyltransferase J [Tropicibacter naphthalenivorans]SMC66304.1 23S rRNA (adenine2030-N6)-methyltransferase [Tropicibacter naphthalenivorans]